MRGAGNPPSAHILSQIHLQMTVLLSRPRDEPTAAQKAATGKAKEKNPGSLTTFDDGEEPERPAEDKVLGGLQWMRIAGDSGSLIP